jgi:hypothetical protein
MEGYGQVSFAGGWMTMQSPDHLSDHVYWRQWTLPADFVAEWDVQNLEPGVGQCAVYCAAVGRDGQDIFAPSKPRRDGQAAQYANGAIDNYQVAYYMGEESSDADASTSGPATGASKSPEAGAKDNAQASVLRRVVLPVPAIPGVRGMTLSKAMIAATDSGGVHKNPGFALVQQGDVGVELDSDAICHMRLVKSSGRIIMSVDGRGFVNWLDDGIAHGPVLGGGKLGLRQTRSAHFRYRNFKAWEIARSDSKQ